MTSRLGDATLWHAALRHRSTDIVVQNARQVFKYSPVERVMCVPKRVERCASVEIASHSPDAPAAHVSSNMW